jgi:hypothetical protein
MAEKKSRCMRSARWRTVVLLNQKSYTM